jgi:FkbM family methyltransferase
LNHLCCILRNSPLCKAALTFTQRDASWFGLRVARLCSYAFRVRLIYDIGMGNGDDTAYYLGKAERVVAVEANPTLIREAATRFAPQIREQKLVLVNKGIAREAGILDFWVNTTLSEWSSFNRKIAGRGGHPLERIPVETVPLQHVMADHGMPDYMKIDIEEHDRFCLHALTPENKPEYISVEFTDPYLLHRLATLGYNRFKIICQFTHRNVQRRLEAPFGFFESLYNLAAQTGEFQRAAQEACGAHHLWETVGKLQKLLSLNFEKGSSGPFGEETDGPWLKYHRVLKLYEKVNRQIRESRSAVPLWCDLHAKTVPQDFFRNIRQKVHANWNLSRTRNPQARS